MFTNFSGAFNVVEVNVTEYSGNRVILPNDLYVALREGYDRDIPLLMKLAESYFPVYGEHSVPHETLAFPKERDFAEDIDEGREQPFVVKPEYVKSMLPLI